ncbi:MAG: tRNA dihydrouridine synthase DusB [Deltaproteobacteria bacterium]
MLPVSIGPLLIDPPLFLAPMAGITDAPFRRLARRMGAGCVATEMVSAEALVRANLKTRRMISTAEAEFPLVVQIFGSNPLVMARAAEMAAEQGAAAIDINMGCPQPKVVKGGAGAALMRDPARAERIVSEIVRAVSVPVTVKIRLGWDEGEMNAPEIARIAEDAGAALVTVHGRTRRQMFSGKADWKAIRRVCEAVAIPVIANGDIASPQDAAKAIEDSGAAGVMIGRGALGRPWIFRELAGLKALSWAEQMDIMGGYLEDACAGDPEAVDLWKVRKHLAWLSRGLPGSAAFRNHITGARSYPEIRELLEGFLESISCGFQVCGIAFAHCSAQYQGEIANAGNTRR